MVENFHTFFWGVKSKYHNVSESHIYSLRISKISYGRVFKNEVKCYIYDFCVNHQDWSDQDNKTLYVFDLVRSRQILL